MGGIHKLGHKLSLGGFNFVRVRGGGQGKSSLETAKFSHLENANS